MSKIVGFGDFLVRLSPPGYLRFLQADSFDINYTGAEANVLVSLALMGEDTEFVTRVPDNDIGRAAVRSLGRYGVGTRHVAWGGERLGVFYLEKGASQRPSRIVYDRKYTSIATCRTEDFDWDAILEGGGWFHVTGITPALSETMPEVTIDACRRAHEAGLTVSCDLNYRKNLWTSAQAKAAMERILPYVDLLVANEEDADKVLDIRAADTDIVAGKLNRDGYRDVAAQIIAKYGVKAVAVSLRRSISASDNEWGGMLYTEGEAHFSKTYPIHIVDRVGGGDSFSAGLIYGMVHGYSAQDTIEYAVAASCLKQTIEMDFNLSTVEEVTRLMNGDGSGRVQR
ncbi:MAG: sugar kinase [Clostridia bacterium]|nr:sugar kinase [Clostridia bacterium]